MFWPFKSGKLCSEAQRYIWQQTRRNNTITSVTNACDAGGVALGRGPSRKHRQQGRHHQCVKASFEGWKGRVGGCWALGDASILGAWAVVVLLSLPMAKEARSPVPALTPPQRCGCKFNDIYGAPRILWKPATGRGRPKHSLEKAGDACGAEGGETAGQRWTRGGRRLPTLTKAGSGFGRRSNR